MEGIESTSSPLRLVQTKSQKSGGHSNQGFENYNEVSESEIDTTSISNTNYQNTNFQNTRFNTSPPPPLESSTPLTSNKPSNLPSNLPSTLTSAPSSVKPSKISELKNWPKPFHERIHLYNQLIQLSSQTNDVQNKTARLERQFRGQTSQFISVITDSNDIWFSGKIRNITLNFGYQAATYFRFGRDLIKHNVYVTLLCLLFILIPQLVKQPLQKTECNAKGLISGESCLLQTSLYYGFYGNGWGNGTWDTENNWTISEENWFSEGYNLPLAYYLGLVGFYIVWLYLVARDVMESLKRGIQVGLLSGTNISMKVFCAWDFSIGQKKSKEQKQKQIKIMLQEDQNVNEVENQQASALAIFVSCVTWSVYLVFLAGIGFGIYKSMTLIENFNDSTQNDYIELWILPVIVVGANYLIPVILSIISYLERSQISKSTFYYFELVRNLLARLEILVMLCVSWYQVYLSNTEVLQDGSRQSTSGATSCWQMKVASTIWRILLTDLLINQILMSIVVNGLLRHFVCVLFFDKKKVSDQNVENTGKTGTEAQVPDLNSEPKNYRQEFKVVDNVLDMMFVQALCWLGIFFFPFLSVFVIIQFIIIFYIRSWLLEEEFITMEKDRYRAVHGKMLISLCELVTLLLSVGWFAFINISTVPGSCGVFRYSENYNEPFSRAIDDLNSNSKVAWLGFILSGVLNPWFIYTINVGLLGACYVAWQYKSAHQRNVDRLKQQLKDWSMKQK